MLRARTDTENMIQVPPDRVTIERMRKSATSSGLVGRAARLMVGGDKTRGDGLKARLLELGMERDPDRQRGRLRRRVDGCHGGCAKRTTDDRLGLVGAAICAGERTAVEAQFVECVEFCR